MAHAKSVAMSSMLASRRGAKLRKAGTPNCLELEILVEQKQEDQHICFVFKRKQI